MSGVRIPSGTPLKGFQNENLLFFYIHIRNQLVCLYLYLSLAISVLSTYYTSAEHVHFSPLNIDKPAGIFVPAGFLI